MEWILAARGELRVLRKKTTADNNNAKQTMSRRTILMRRGCCSLTRRPGRLAAWIPTSTDSIVAPAHTSDGAGCLSEAVKHLELFSLPMKRYPRRGMVSTNRG